MRRGATDTQRAAARKARAERRRRRTSARRAGWIVCTLLVAGGGIPGEVQGESQSRGRIVSVAVEGTALEVRLASGRRLSGADLTGASLTLVAPHGTVPQHVRIDAVAVDPRDPERETLLYQMSAVDPRTGRSESLCAPNAQGERWVFPLQGQWDREGNRLTDRGFTLACADWALGKCVRFGYKPWKTRADGTSLAPYHQACVRLVRADYCGGKGTTRDGMLIDIYDRLGIQQPDPDPKTHGLRFEAAWGPAGAVCVAHTRVTENMTLDQLATECPRLRGHLGEQACLPPKYGVYTGEALLYNSSR
ncbi:hypothetical protein GCM10023089_31450 [Quisquiliibacterium transsilvanicum]|nr:ADYC domain-containing protein [Quisquiliibacterium transsilvanicum]